ncbi:hypothetical protein Pmani_000893 [Petrolisthes manimaculis]|uniref:Uncharacterized protein n=1 Tax=Petrolisthes manimaculis TaxID=1843537 RepID=A0AAE1ULV9_9EUCA|nr:hypothetical protein Pmani_000893 [Petrolisthes manimaculis]
MTRRAQVTRKEGMVTSTPMKLMEHQLLKEKSSSTSKTPGKRRRRQISMKAKDHVTSLDCQLLRACEGDLKFPD